MRLGPEPLPSRRNWAELVLPPSNETLETPENPTAIVVDLVYGYVDDGVPRSVNPVERECICLAQPETRHCNADATVKNCTQKDLKGTLSQNVRRSYVVFVSRHLRSVVYVREGERERNKTLNVNKAIIKTQSSTTHKSVACLLGCFYKLFRRDRRARVS